MRSRSRRRHSEPRGHHRRRVRRRDAAPCLRSVSQSLDGDPEPRRQQRRRRRRVRQRSASAQVEDGSRNGAEWSPVRNRGFSDVNSTPIGVRRVEVSPSPVRSGGEEQETSKTRIWVLHKDCAKVIGKGGREMKQLEIRTRTRLKVQREDEMDKETKERYIDIIGSASEQKEAKGLIVEMVTYCRDAEDAVLKDIRVAPPDKDGVPYVIQVATEDVGRVIGRNGDTIRLIEKDSGTKIEVDKAQCKVEIFGEEAKQEQAKELVLAEVTFATAEDGTVLKDTRPKRADAEESQPPLRFWVKDREAGKVIGRSGETVREVMEKTGAEIKVQKADEMSPNTRERAVSIYGTKEQQEQALALLLEQSLTWVKAEDGQMLREPKSEPKKEASLQKKLEGPLQVEPRNKRGGQRRRTSRAAAKESHPTAPRYGERGQRHRSDGRGTKSSAWVCATCGADHRTKDCPHTSGVVGVGMQLGMQMGMQAMSLPGMHMPSMPPMMGGPVGPLVPMMGLHGLQGALPLRRTQSSSGSEFSSDEYSDYGGSEASRSANAGKQPPRLKMPTSRGPRGSRSRSRDGDARRRIKGTPHLGTAQPTAPSKSKRDHIQLADL